MSIGPDAVQLRSRQSRTHLKRRPSVRTCASCSTFGRARGARSTIDETLTRLSGCGIDPEQPAERDLARVSPPDLGKGCVERIGTRLVLPCPVLAEA
jgi:hypothetical protein